MKKVRFETPVKSIIFNNMEDNECHTPRPFTERPVIANAPDIYNYPKVLPYSNDPVQLFECSNRSPYPTMNKTNLPCHEQRPQWSPCNDLELSLLDATNYEPWKPTFNRSILKPSGFENNSLETNTGKTFKQYKPSTPTSSENKTVRLPNVLVKDDDFFIKRDNLGKIHINMNPIQHQLCKLSLDKENNPLLKKAEIMQMTALSHTDNNTLKQLPSNDIIDDCRCHHCIKRITPNVHNTNRQQIPYQHLGNCSPYVVAHNSSRQNCCKCAFPPAPSTCCDHIAHIQQCQSKSHDTEQFTGPKMNAVDKKTWAIEKYEQSQKSDSMEVEKQTNVVKEKREPTVSDLFKIIKLQNEQLQLLQEKVDKFISASQQSPVPVQNCVSEHVAIETVDNEQHKISIGVMTSFEMVRTSTIINKEVVKTSENAQIQCNRSQISIKEVLSKAQSPNLNFLEGIAPADIAVPEAPYHGDVLRNIARQNTNEEKTLNEFSLYNVQVDNATTPLMSPEQSLCLDVRDYSDSEAGSDDQSNVGWTYYNKVMTHVNGMLQDSDMPSSASALYRNTRQHMHTLQMQIDKTNVSVTKRVKFGDDPLGIHQPHIYAGPTDTSLKMNQLAAKYLKSVPPAPAPPRPAPRSTTAPIDMSFATRNYMERHKLLQGVPAAPKPPSPTDMPRFLDITALKQQPKFL